MSLPTLPAAPPDTPLATQRVAIVTVFAISAAVCVLTYLAFAAHGPWFGGAPSLHWSAHEFAVTRGTAQLGPEGLVVSAPDATRTVVVAVSTAFRARDYPQIAWEASGVPDDVQATLLWYSDIDSTRVFRRTLSVEAGRIVPAAVAQDRGWVGRIGGLALVLQGGFTEPIVLHAADAKSMSAAQVAGDRLSEWLAFEPWNGASINTLTGGADAQDLPLPIFLAAVVGIAALVYAGLARWKPHVFGPVLGTGVAMMFVIGWLAIDARWQWNLLRQAGSTYALYAGKAWRERHLAAEDAPLFAFIEEARVKLPAPPARVFMVAGANYFRGRGAYHLYPYNVYFDPWSDTVPAPSAVRSGDYIVVYQRKGVQFDAARQQLRWDALPPLDADLVLGGPGAALFRMR